MMIFAITFMWVHVSNIFLFIIHQIFSLVCNWSKHVTWPNIPQLKLGNIREYSPIFKTACVAKKIWRIINTIASILRENMLGYLPLDIICSSKLTVFLKLRSWKTVRLAQIMSADKYPSIFSRQMEAIVYSSFKNLLKLWFSFRAQVQVHTSHMLEKRWITFSVDYVDFAIVNWTVSCLGLQSYATEKLDSFLFGWGRYASENGVRSGGVGHFGLSVDLPNWETWYLFSFSIHRMQLKQ